MKYTIRATMYSPQYHRIRVELNNTYEIDIVGKGWRRWLATKCFNLLKRLGYVGKHIHEDCSTTITCIEFDIEKIERKILESRETMLMIYNRDVKTLIVGASEYTGLISSVTCKIPPNYRSHLQHNGTRLQYEGIDIVMVPWFDGIIPLTHELVPDRGVW